MGLVIQLNVHFNSCIRINKVPSYKPVFTSILGPPPLSDMQFGHRKNEPNCLMCMNFNKDPLYPSKCGLDHFYCKSCTKHLLKKTGLCPQCDKEGLLQPTGNMTWITKKESLPGYEDCEVIAMFFTFYEGIQGTSI